MPLLKRKPYGLSKPPEDLKPHELVFQVRFTKEIFKDYEEYLKRINLYRLRVWTCKVTGKSNLTYEEALVSERRATERVQQFPKEFMGPVLNLVQFSVLRLDELVNTIFKAYKDNFVVGEEIACVKGDFTRPCKIMSVLPSGEQGHENGKVDYEVGWLDSDKNVIRTSIELADSLVRKKSPFTRALLKSFIRESVRDNLSRNAPWVVHEKLCRKYKITTDPPEDLQRFFVKQETNYQEANGGGKRLATEDLEVETYVYKKRRKKDTEDIREGGNKLEDEKVQKNSEDEKVQKTEAVKVKPIKYPIEDSLVQPSADDPLFTDRPGASSDFPLPMDCIGQMLMVWNFCIVFGKAIHLSPFSLEELEKALECNDGDPLLLRETHLALLKLAISDPEVHQSFVQKRRRKVSISIQTWKDDLSDFLELEGVERLASRSSTIRKGYYRQLEPSVKLDILCELVEQSLVSSVVRDQLDLYIEEKQAIASQKRKEEIEEIKKGKEVQERSRLAQTSDAAHDSPEASTREAPEDGESEGSTDDEESLEKKSNSNGLVNGICENGVVEDESTLVSGPRSRQSKLKLMAALKQAEEKEKEKKRIEEQKVIQEKKKVQAEALRERKLQEKKMIELQRRQEHLEREMEKRIIRTSPLGRDRDYNRYWFFAREGRIFVENEDSTKWGYYSAKEELDALYGSLNPKGIREKALQRQLEKQFSRISDAMQKRTKDIAQRIAAEDAFVRRSSRVKSVPQEKGPVAYKNKYRNS